MCRTDEEGTYSDFFQARTYDPLVAYGGACAVTGIMLSVLIKAVKQGAEWAEKIGNKAASKIKQDIQGHYVYVLVSEANQVVYVGRTTDIEKRKIAHSRNPARANTQMTITGSGLSYFEARALEQAGMLYHHTINKGNKTNNQINGISPVYWDIYRDWAKKALDYGWNQMTNELLN